MGCVRAHGGVAVRFRTVTVMTMTSGADATIQTAHGSRTSAKTMVARVIQNRVCVGELCAGARDRSRSR